MTFDSPCRLGRGSFERTRVTGGFDTIQGSVWTEGSNGAPVDLQAYAALLRSHHFRVNYVSESSTLDANTADGGGLQVGLGTIRFSYFGDF